MEIIFRFVTLRDNIIIAGILISLIFGINSLPCDKIPEGVRKQKNINDIDRYIIVIHGNPKTYTPNQKYNVSLQVNPTVTVQKAFKRFILNLESEKDSTATNQYHPTGQFEFEYGSAVLAKFSERCPNTVIENSKLPKSKIQLYWVAPPENSGCVYIKATVVESRDNWFSEDGQLTKKLCEDNTDEDFKPPIVTSCCSCDEAKYEVAFEGRWTRNTHPRGYPSDVWATKFSDIIGTSHQVDHSFWSEATIASDGLKIFAETGVTDRLESELKEMGENIRTIIKARGLGYPNITQSSFAVFRVDNKNHLVSLVTKIIPSPDWIVGVSNFELCKEDCTWEESYTYNLYPIDVGTNDGLEYSSSVPLYKQKEIAPITPNNPNDPRSPFYSEDGEPMNPIAKLHFTRQRIYEKPCFSVIDEESNSSTDHSVLPTDEANCEVEEWSDWSSCSSSCGTGVRIKERKLKYPKNEAVCPDVELIRTEECIEERNCESGIDTNCPNRRWGPWGPCNVTCGSGYQSRIILPQDDSPGDDDNNEQEHVCSKQEIVECNVPCTDSNEEQSTRRGEDCRVSWSAWSDCDLNGESCGQGVTRRSYSILANPEEGGEPCPPERIQEKICSIPCEKESRKSQIAANFYKKHGNSGSCIMSKWSDWTPCSSKCGTSALQQRSRKIIYKPPEVGACPPRLDYKPCNLPIACTDKGVPIYL
nr:spondin-1-like [Leptinotarsa decemlineata]